MALCLQVQRLREHIDKKHAELADANGGATADASADSKGTAESSAQQTLQAGSKASRHCRHFSRCFSDVGCVRCPDTLYMQGKTMDVGAKAGFYTEKSPKMLLQEWCIQKKRPTPRYRVTANDEGEQITKAKVCSADLSLHAEQQVTVLAALPWMQMLSCLLAGRWSWQTRRTGTRMSWFFWGQSTRSPTLRRLGKGWPSPRCTGSTATAHCTESCLSSTAASGISSASRWELGPWFE